MVSRARVRGFAGYITRFNRSTKGLKNDGSQVNIEKFDGTGDFELWRIKMCALLIQYGCEAALEILPANIEAQAKAELNKKAQSAVILCLVSYGHFVDTLLYRREALTLVDVMAILNLKEIKERSKAKGDDGKGLYVRGRTDHKGLRQSWGKSRSKSRGGRLKCYICQFEDHLKRNYLKNNCKKSIGYVNKDDQPSSSECDGGNVQLGDNKECKIRGIGKVRVQLRDRSSFVLHNVTYIPELKRNLISLGTLEKEGFIVKLQSSTVKVINDSRVVLSRIRKDNCVYSLDGHAMASELNASVEKKDSLAQVWHKRLGHISEAGLQVLKKQGLFGKNSLGKLDFCENCDLGNSHLFSFGVGRHTTQGVIDYVHSDLWGSFQVESLRVENQTGRTVKKLRTNNGLEFCNQEFEQLCVKSGIARHLTVVGEPQQNGSPSTMIKKKTPMEMWSGHPSDYWMLRIFSYVTYPHDKLGKPKPRTVKCVLLGYSEGVKGYRLYRLDNETPKIVTYRNVVFNESVMYKDTLKDSGAGTNKSVEELHAEVELQRLNNHTPEEDQTDQEDGDDEDAGDQETDQTLDLTDYQLTQDREPRTRTKPLRFQDESNMAAYAFIVAEEEDTHKPLTYQEVVACEDNSKWKDVMK
ncbi:retrotransposon protein, putative, ty1-copia subclass [Tanacetum coccineum]